MRNPFKIFLLTSIIAILAACSENSHAAFVQCYSGNKKIYSAYVSEIYMADEGLLVMHDTKTERDVVIQGSCVIKM